VSADQLTPILDRKLVFVTGKGGTGKTTVASGLALLAASRGKKVLICEIDAKGELAGYYEAPPTGFKEKEVQPGVFAMTMDTEASLREYLRLQLRIPIVGRIGPVAKAFDFLATAAPGVREILTVGKLCFEVRDGDWDIVIVDAPATGHIVGQLAAPQAVNGLVKVGLIRTQTEWMLEMLSDPAITGLLAVCTPEEMPVTETIELAVRVREETTVQLAGVIVNRVLPELFGRQEEAVFEALTSGDPLAELDALVGGDAGPVLEAARLAAGPARQISSAFGTGSTRPCRCSTCPSCSRAHTGCGRPVRWPSSSARSWATDGRPDPQGEGGGGRCSCAHHGQPAGHQGDRGGLWAGRSGQDDHRGGLSTDGSGASRFQGAGPHRRSGQAAGQRARSRRDRQHGVSGAGFGVHGRRSEAPG
jgi:anion-transporting  ArsA/GET3 family ATPase